MKGYIDLHCHSSFSDGAKTVEQLVDDAIIENVKFLSITDHDDVRSIKELKSLKDRNIVLIAGVELSTTLTLNGKSYDMHLLGYGFDEDNDDITKIMQHYRDNRFQENMNFFGKICELDIDTSDCLCNIKLENYNDILKEIRMTLYKNNYDLDYINNFISRIKKIVPSYDGYEIDTLYAINAIINAGGVAVLAHPAQIEANYKELV